MRNCNELTVSPAPPCGYYDQPVHSVPAPGALVLVITGVLIMRWFRR